MNTYEPHHLLDFKGDPDLQYCYRSLLKDDSLGLCEVCKSPLLLEDRTRVKPPQALDRTIRKLMAKTSKKILLNKFESFKLKKFIQSSQQMVVKCSQCNFINKKPIMGREQLVTLKDELLSTVENSDKEPDEEPAIEKSKKRKRKKKKKKTEERRNPNSLISDEEDEKNDELHNTSIFTPKSSFIPLTPKTSSKTDSVSLRNFVRSETKDSSSIAIFQKAINTKAPNQTPVSTKPGAKTNQSNSLPHSKKQTNLMRKQLKKFLSESSQESEKNPSLQDFLTML